MKKSKLLESNFDLRKQTLLSVSDELINRNDLILGMDITLFAEFEKWMGFGVYLSEYKKRG